MVYNKISVPVSEGKARFIAAEKSTQNSESTVQNQVNRHPQPRF